MAFLQVEGLEEVPDVAVGQGWEAERGDIPGCAAVLVTDGAVRLSKQAARHLAALLLAYAAEGD